MAIIVKFVMWVYEIDCKILVQFYLDHFIPQLKINDVVCKIHH